MIRHYALPLSLAVMLAAGPGLARDNDNARNTGQAGSAGNAASATGGDRSAEPGAWDAPPGEEPANVTRLRELGAKITPLPERHGLGGWLAEFSDRQHIFYRTPDGKAVIVGMMLDGEGRNVTAEQLAALVRSGDLTFDEKRRRDARAERQRALLDFDSADTDDDAPLSAAETVGERLFNALETAHWIEVGTNPQAPVIYSFVDPNCPHCKSFFRDLATPYLRDGRLRLRLIPTGLMGEDSTELAARLLDSDNPVESWVRLVRDDRSGLGQPASRDARAQEEANSRLFFDWQGKATPWTIYRNASGAVKVVAGKPGNLQTMIDDILVR